MESFSNCLFLNFLWKKFIHDDAILTIVDGNFFNYVDLFFKFSCLESFLFCDFHDHSNILKPCVMKSKNICSLKKVPEK